MQILLNIASLCRDVLEPYRHLQFSCSAAENSVALCMREKEQYKMSMFHCLVVFVPDPLLPILTVSVYLQSHTPQHSHLVFSRRAVTDIHFSYRRGSCFVPSLCSF